MTAPEKLPTTFIEHHEWLKTKPQRIIVETSGWWDTEAILHPGVSTAGHIDTAVGYFRADVVDELVQALEGALALMPDDEGPEIDAARAALARYRGGA